MNRSTLAVLVVTLVALLAVGCGKGAPEVANRDYVHQTEIKDVRLGDGVPLSLSLAIRWRIEDGKAFSKQFVDPEQYAKLVFDTKAQELAGKIANTYASVAAVFKPEREKFVQQVKETLTQRLAESGIQVKEVIIAQMLFPKNFTDALEVTATKDLELARIREKNVIDLEQAKAEQSQAQAEGQVQVEKAKIEGKVAEINAQTEDKRRLSQVAKAETEGQVLERRTKSEVERQRLLAQREVEKQRELNRVDLERQTNLKDLELKKQKEFDQVQITKEKELATLTAGNPAYATFLVNRELASKVQIAVLPLGTESGVLGNIIQHSLTGGARK